MATWKRRETARAICMHQNDEDRAYETLIMFLHAPGFCTCVPTVVQMENHKRMAVSLALTQVVSACSQT